MLSMIKKATSNNYTKNMKDTNKNSINSSKLTTQSKHFTAVYRGTQSHIVAYDHYHCKPGATSAATTWKIEHGELLVG